MRRSSASRRPIATTIFAIACVLVAGCASTRVVRAPPARHALFPVRVSAPRYGATATVHTGETLYRIATEHDVSVLDLAMWNAVAPPYVIHPGDVLRLYPPSHVSQPRAHAVASTSSTHVGNTAPTAIVTPSIPEPTQPPPSALQWQWPADGAIASRFVAGEPTQQGIDIAGQAGQPVRAAADGVVVYSGSGLVGYGELVIVKHSDTWLSAYGHNRARLVNEGQRVTAGQTIAEMGHSGASADMLHFEIRYNGKPVDPMTYLPRRAQQ